MVKNKDGTQTLRYLSLLLSSNPEFYLQHFRLQVILNMDATATLEELSNQQEISAGARRSAMAQKGKRQSSTCCRDSGTKERKIEKAERE